MINSTIQVVTNGHYYQPILMNFENSISYLIYTDQFGRKWRLDEVTNENIKFPFIITPLEDEK